MVMLVIVKAGVIICLAGIVQSTVGFGFALFATPLLVWLDIPLPSVITLVATCSMIQAIIGSRKLQTAVPWRLSLLATAIRLTSIIFGIFLLKRLVGLNTDYIRMVIGCIICLLVVIQILLKPHPVKTIHWGWAGLAFITSGLLVGVCGMGGPPLVLWSMSHNWSTQKIRGFLFAVFATTIPVQIVILGLTFGSSILWSAVIGIIFLPLVYMSTIIGLPIGTRMGKERLRYFVYAILLIIGVSAIIPVFF